jgi:hypothetical protein
MTLQALHSHKTALPTAINLPETCLQPAVQTSLNLPTITVLNLPGKTGLQLLYQTVFKHP